MKFIFFILICCAAISVYGQGHDDSLVGTRIWRAPSLPMQNGDIVYSDTISLPKEYTQKRLQRNAYEWIKYNLTKDKRAINSDTMTDVLTGTGIIKYNQGTMNGRGSREIKFQYRVTTMTGGYYYSFYNITGTNGQANIKYTEMYNEDNNAKSGAQQWTGKERYEMLSDLHSYMTLMITGLQKAMLK